ncbi:hypothetical protein HPB50_001531 [Hyalomma asiaticum]|uniref:Uncharacterized protein n=1 Tax=Hyalomma asiaticum TaxID=266040 RepID=A0ACB7SI47_HYAAI|nr:hypothetical protein HPB50_001531 [Hyalomma asiaticum]
MAAMEADMQQMDAIFHVYCAICAVIKVLGVVFASAKDDYRVANFVRYAVLLAFHGLRLRPAGPPASAMSLLRWETLFFLCDEFFHVARAASDLGVVIDACVHGIPSMAALTRVMASLFVLAFHTIYLGPRSSLASDAAIFFSDMQFHFFHMLLCTWQLVHYLWTTQNRKARTYVYHWTCFLFHTGIVWFYTNGITVSIRVQLINPGAENNAPIPMPPPMPRAPNPEAIAMAIAAARAADAAAARLALQRNSSASSNRDSPQLVSGSPQRGSSRGSSRRDSTLGLETPLENVSEPTRLPEDRATKDVFGSVTQTLSGSSVSTSSKTALVPYVERPLLPRSDTPGQRGKTTMFNSHGHQIFRALLPVCLQLIRSLVPHQGPTQTKGASLLHLTRQEALKETISKSPTSEQDSESTQRAAAQDSAATFTYGSSELVLDLDESSVKCPTIVRKADRSPAEFQDLSLPGPSCSRAQDVAKKPKSPRTQSAKQSPATSRKSSSATPFHSPTAARCTSFPGSPSRHAADTQGPHRAPGESQSNKQSPTLSRKSSGSGSPPFKSPTTARGSFPGSPSSGAQDLLEKLERCREQSAKQSEATSPKPSPPAAPSESPE